MWALNKTKNEIGIIAILRPLPAWRIAGMTQVDPSTKIFELRSEAMNNAVFTWFCVTVRAIV